MRKTRLAGIVVGCGLPVVGDYARAELPPLIPREVLFGNPDRLSPKISPDGTRLAYIAPHEGVLNVWVRDIGTSEERVVTRDRRRGIRFYFWAHDNRHVLYIQDEDGDENWHIYAVDLTTNDMRDLTPIKGVQARIVGTEPRFPDEILVAINDRDPQLHDIHRLHLETGKLTLEARNDQGFVGWVADHELRVRGAVGVRPDGGLEMKVRNSGAEEWRTLTRWDAEDALNSGPIGFTSDDRGLYVISSAGSNTGELRRIDVAGGEETVLARDDVADVAEVLVHPLHKTVQAVGFQKERMVWKVLDGSIAEDFAAIERLQRGDFGIINRDDADRTWLVYFQSDDGPVVYYAYHRETRRADRLFSNRAALEGLTLARMKPVTIPARDGLELHGYLTLPPGVEPEDLPMVINVHGGPWWRDRWGFNSEVQWLANRGYAVLQVNFRGSRGYGKKFLNAGNREWGGKMHDDLVDGLRWAAAQGLVDTKRVGLFGGSYGGYATLVGLAFTPDLFACGVDIVGPSNLITFMKTIPPYWKPLEPIFFDRVGHPEKDADFLKGRSPLFRAHAIEKPLLIAQGANDPRVKKEESRQLVEALEKAGRTVEYIEYADEGHGFARPENRLHFFARAERFLAEHLGGRYEPAEMPEAEPGHPPQATQLPAD